MTRVEPGRIQFTDNFTIEPSTSIWQGAADGDDPRQVVLDAVAQHFMSRAHPGWRLVEVNGGRCDFAPRVGSRVGANRITIMNTDDEVLAKATENGLHTHQGGVPHLPCSDNNFDVVVALWSLAFVEDLDAALKDIHRVLRPGGRFLALAAGEDHLADLIDEAGGTGHQALTAENGLEAIGEHFTSIKRTKIQTRAVFADYATAHAYLARVDPEMADRLPEFEGPREYVGESTLFTCGSTNHPVPPTGENVRGRRVPTAVRPMRPPTGINHPGLTPAGLPPPGTLPPDTRPPAAGPHDPGPRPNGMDFLDFAKEPPPRSTPKKD